MSEYYLADHRASERSQQKEQDREPKARQKAENIKVTLLGDFMFPTSESPGCDPYNSTQGKPAHEPWRVRRDRR